MQSQNGEQSDDSVPKTNLPPGVVPPVREVNPQDQSEDLSVQLPPEPPPSALPPTAVFPFSDELWLRPPASPGHIPLDAVGDSDLNAGQVAVRRRPDRLWFALAIAFSVALVAGILVSVTSGGGARALSPAALVQAAAHRTAAENTADVSLNGSVTTDGIDVPVSGSGEVDFATKNASLDMEMSIEGVSISLDEIVTRYDIFERISGSTLGNNQQWVETPIPETSNGIALQDGGEDPTSELALLSASDASVKKLGVLEIGGVGTTEYSVVPNKKVIEEGIKKELSSLDVSALVKQQLEKFETSPPSMKLDVWIDGSGLLKRVEENISLPLSGSSAAVSGNLDFSFDNYGTPVQITLPPLSDVTSLSGLLSATADHLAQSNLTDAMTEAKALYQVDQSYGSNDKPYSVEDFGSQAPEFSWTAGSCKPDSTNCISIDVLDVGSAGDHQGVALAIYSGSGSCWYAVDLETNPSSLPGDPNAIWTTWNGGANVGLVAGVFFARTAQSVPQDDCAASDVLSPGFVVGWGQSYSSAGTIG